jgi:glucose/arabinose dehydrogenase
MKTSISAVAALLCGLIVVAGAHPGRAQTQLTTELVASGLARPVFVTAPPGDKDRIFIVEQRSGSTGRIRIVDRATGVLNPTPFLSIAGLSTGSEQGLLGLAFHPDYANNGYFYVNYTAGGFTYIERYTVSADPDVADATSATPIMQFAQPYTNHNGGWLAFGPNGYLYIATGDGGSAGDPGDRAQDITDQKLGKLLRIDVDADDFPADPTANYAIPPDNPFVGVTGDDEIWAYGLRNPWRDSFDAETGDLWIADVGQSTWEEIDFQPADSAGGQNYGWRCYEGDAAYNTTGCAAADTMVFPIHTYSHDGGRCSITGGYVYRGCEIPDLTGTYFFADYCSAQIWSFRYDGVTMSEFTERTAELDPPGSLTIASVSSFGEDAFGELYICDLGGAVLKIVPATANPDSDGDGVSDNCDACPAEPALIEPNELPEEVSCSDGVDNDCDGLTDGQELFCQADPCVCGDIAGDGGTVNLDDFATFAVCFGRSLPAGACPLQSLVCSDLDGNGTVNLADFSTFALLYGTVSTALRPECLP